MKQKSKEFNPVIKTRQGKKRTQQRTWTCTKKQKQNAKNEICYTLTSWDMVCICHIAVWSNTHYFTLSTTISILHCLYCLMPWFKNFQWQCYVTWTMTSPINRITSVLNDPREHNISPCLVHCDIFSLNFKTAVVLYFLSM